jgi:pantetheine-phosphate adenylyltransferase
MGIAIYPGSFDPVTLGHLDIIKRAATQFDHVIVCVMFNSHKSGLFQPEERVELIERVTSDLGNVEVDMSSQLLAQYAKGKGASCIVKGLRAMSDFEEEFQMATINRKLNPKLDTIFLTACQDFTYLSSSIVKEMARYNVKLEGFVSPLIEKDVNQKMKEHLALENNRQKK